MEHLVAHIQGEHRNARADQADPVTASVVAVDPVLTVVLSAVTVLGNVMWKKPRWHKPAALLLGISSAGEAVRLCAGLSRDLHRWRSGNVSNRAEHAANMLRTTLFLFHRSVYVVKFFQYLDSSGRLMRAVDQLYLPGHYSQLAAHLIDPAYSMVSVWEGEPINLPMIVGFIEKSVMFGLIGHIGPRREPLMIKWTMLRDVSYLAASLMYLASVCYLAWEEACSGSNGM